MWVLQPSLHNITSINSMNIIVAFIGILLLLAPFFLVLIFPNKRQGFLTIASGVGMFHLLLGLIAGTLGIFTYGVIFLVNLVTASIVLYVTYKYLVRTYSLQKIRVDIRQYIREHGSMYMSRYWFIALVCLFLIGGLLSIHFYYTGPADIGGSLVQLSKDSYAYPFYSDEWVGASLVNYSIDSGKLPLVNPLYKNQPFTNFLFLAHVLIAEMMLLFGLNAFTGYVFLAVGNTTLLCLAVYFGLRFLSVGRSVAILSSVFPILITNSGNLPSTWSLLPYSVSLMFLCWSIVGYIARNRVAHYLNLLIALLLYPPMIVFVAPILCVSSWQKISNRRMLLIVCGIIAVLGSLALWVGHGYIIRNPLDEGRTYYALWNVMPFFVLFFIAVGCIETYRRELYILMAPIIVGIFFWILYTFISKVIIIEPARIVVITSVLLMFVAGLGLHLFAGFIVREVVTHPIHTLLFKIVSIVFLAFWMLHLSRFGLWHKLKLVIQYQGQTMYLIPAPPVTRYLNPDDIKLFAPYTGVATSTEFGAGKIFIAPPWKGLVVGTITGNYPLESKSSTITNRFLVYDAFMKADCIEKNKLVKKFKIDLVYSSRFDCEGFDLLGSSSEHLYLFRTSLPF